MGSDYYGHGIRQYGNLGLSTPNHNKWDSFGQLFATVWLINGINSMRTNSVERNFELFDTPDHYVDNIYIRNLNTLKLLAQHIGAFAIFVPQVLNYASYERKDGSHGWTRHIKNDSMPMLMSRFNAHMDGICLRDDRRCAVLHDVLEEKWVSDDFVDNGHFSRSGGAKFSEIIALFIRSRWDNLSHFRRAPHDVVP